MGASTSEDFRLERITAAAPRSLAAVVEQRLAR